MKKFLLPRGLAQIFQNILILHVDLVRISHLFQNYIAGVTKGKYILRRIISYTLEV